MIVLLKTTLAVIYVVYINIIVIVTEIQYIIMIYCSIQYYL